ncbi:hypothetical protein F5Y08DRAFT_342125 [Xylaria arbuscula]|nr:hypothetical protein F5Y08DRAFT_342125 [Xylaria arbuscula]
MSRVKEKEMDLGTRIQAIVLHSEGYSRASIIEKTGYSAGGLSGLLTKAKARGYVPGQGPILRAFVDNEPGGRTGRPPKLTQGHKDKIVALKAEAIANDHDGDRGASGGSGGGGAEFVSTQKLADKFNAENPGDVQVSRRTVLRALKAAGVQHVRRTAKTKARSGVKKRDAATKTTTKTPTTTTTTTTTTAFTDTRMDTNARFGWDWP